MKKNPLYRPMTAEQYMALPESCRPYELIRGRLRQVKEAWPSRAHGSCQAEIAYLLGVYLHANPIASVSVDSGITLSRNPDTVRVPDISVVRNERFPRDYAGGPIFDVAPDLAIEIRSPSERPSRLNPKIHDYLAAGTTMVWVIDQPTRSVTIHTADAPPRIIEGNASLTGDPVLPGFSCTLDELFA
jgi:Uma2 family endonuclease